MSIFTIELIEVITGKNRFYKLLHGDRCDYDDFCNKCKANPIFKKQLATLQTRLMYVAQLKFDHLDETKYRELKGRKSNDPYKDYEIKTKNLRIYFFKDEGTGQIIVSGGKKDSQHEDINRMRIIKSNYFKNKK